MTDQPTTPAQDAPDTPLTFPSWPAILRSIMLGLWALYFLVLIASGAFKYYIRPLYAVLPMVGGVVLVAMIWTGRRRLREVHVHDAACRDGYESCAYRHRFQFRFLAPMAIFLLPLVFAVCVPPSALNALIAEKKGLNLHPVKATAELKAAIQAATSQPAGGPVPSASVQQILGALSNGAGLGRLVSAQAMVMIPKDRRKYPHLPHDAVFITHFVIICCAADAITSSLVLLRPDDAQAPWPPAHGQWNTVVGTGELIPWGEGMLLPALRVRTFVPQDKPADPFLYK